MASNTSSSSSDSWQRFSRRLCRYSDIGFSLDTSRMAAGTAFLEEMEPACQRAMAAMTELEAGATANADEQRMVGHYWLRDPELAPTSELRDEIERDGEAVRQFASAVHAGEITSASGRPFSRILLIGIGGSALGPQLVADCLAAPSPRMAISFFDNTDPDGMERVLTEIGDELSTTLAIVVSKSGGTKETRNGMLRAERAFRERGILFPRHAVAVTGVGSQLDEEAKSEKWLDRFSMSDWVGGRTSVTSVVGLLPAALQGVDIDRFLAGAAAMDGKTRSLPTRENAAMLMALMWHAAGSGRGAKDMVVLPYKDRLALLSNYLQQLVMESLGKERDVDGNKVNQGIAVYGNKGSTDQHAYVQQLRDGVNNFFVTFIEVREAMDGDDMEVEPGIRIGDYLQGFLRGTRSALSENERESMTISVPRADAFNLGALIAVFERAVGFYASLVGINAYHQPGVEAGKKAAGAFLDILRHVEKSLAPELRTAAEIARDTGADPETVYHALEHLAANRAEIIVEHAQRPDGDRFGRKM